ncbi:hypothetical protein ACE7GA_11710 [Roseomonas sp. CCTCC AB2023176]|uniref:hypothetical protein n=1 Tax=Roseomonas sp. CCTCC AB2023176 TaxID=3342640 RepID=UPI0035E02331
MSPPIARRGLLLGPAAFLLPADARAAALHVLGRRFEVPGTPPPVPDDITGDAPSDEDALGEVEERRWAARLRREIGSRPEARPLIPEPDRALRLRWLEERFRSLDALARAMRLAMGRPEVPAEGDFTPPGEIPPDFVARHAVLGFDPLASHAAYRRVRAAYRAGDVALLAAASRFPVNLNRGRDRDRRVLRSASDMTAVRDTVMQPRLRDVALAQPFGTMFARDVGLMFGHGELWLRFYPDGFGLSAINLP